MSATEQLIAAEVGQMSFDEKKASIAESVTSSSSTTVSTHHCRTKHHHGCNPCYGYFLPQPCMMPQWPVFCVPHSHCQQSLPPPCPCIAPVPCCQYVTKKPEKESKVKKEDATESEHKSCNCCQEGKCECCKTGKLCGEKDEKADSDAGSTAEDKEETVEEDEEKEDDEEGKEDEDEEGKEDENDGGVSVAKLIHQFSKDE